MKSKGGNPALSRRIDICCLGSVDQTLLEHVADHISDRFGFTCEISSKMGSPEYAFDEKRRQYNSKLILRHLAKRPHDSLTLLAVTQVDLFVPILKYVFGLAQVGGRCAVISTYRLRPLFYGKMPSQDLLLERAGKTALHELGHSLGLTHCRDRRCVMHSSTAIADTDYKQSTLCPTCLELCRWQLENSGTETDPPVPNF